jgi:hypothetical protein
MALPAACCDDLRAILGHPGLRHLGVHVLLQAWSVVGGMVHLKIIRPGPTSAMVRERN